MIIAVLTAVPTEYEIMRNLFAREKTGEIQEKFEGAFFHEIIPISINNTSINIILGMSDQGNVEASIAVNYILRECKPDLFFFTGTCGGIKDVSIGDSIIVTEVFDLFRGKAGDTWCSKPTSGRMAAEKRGICISMMMEINRGEVLPEYYFNIGNKLYMGAIGSSSAIVASEHTKIREIIKNQYANIVAVEMEGYGFYQTLERNGYRSGVMIRAVTDDAKSKTQDADDIIQPVGMKKVYHVVYEFIRKYVTSIVPALPQSTLDKKDTLEKLKNQYSDGTSTHLPKNSVPADFMDSFLNAIVYALQVMQKDKTYYGSDEDSRNRFVSAHLTAQLKGTGYTCADQQSGGCSSAGKAPGERDFVVKNKVGQEILIYEGLNLTSLNKAYLDKHIDKVLVNYNPQGLRYSILVTYLECDRDKFKSFMNKYREHIADYAPESYRRIGEPEEVDFNGGFLCCMKMQYEVGGVYFTIYHIIVRMGQ